MKLAWLTSLALIAFAANSILTRAALNAGGMNAMLFATIRVASGAAILLALLSLRKRHGSTLALGSWTGALWLFLYVVPFSLAYQSLSTGTGALILFGMVQVTMIMAGYRAGERPKTLKWGGMTLAALGLILLVFPGVSAPPIWGATLMAGAGVSWGLYSLLGRRASHPLSATAGNMLRALPATVLVTLLVRLPESAEKLSYSYLGVLCAVLSGAVMSGIGYAIWYAVLPVLRATTAATLQLTVPVIAALGGVLFLSEPISLRLFVASWMILGGAFLAIIVGNHDSAHST